MRLLVTNGDTRRIWVNGSGRIRRVKTSGRDFQMVFKVPRRYCPGEVPGKRKEEKVWQGRKVQGSRSAR